MSEDDIKAASEELAKREKDYHEKIANLEQDKANMVDELKAEREAKRIAKEELEKTKTKTDLNITDPIEIVKRVLQEKEVEESKGAFEQAKAELKETYNEFSSETDTSGIVFKKFEDEMAKFNFSGLKTKEEYKARLNEVYEHMNRTKKPSDSVNFHTGTKQFGSEQRTTDSSTLSDKEVKLINEMGWDKERFLKTKEKRPAYVASLLKYRG